MKHEGRHCSELDTKMGDAEARGGANSKARRRRVSYPFSPPDGHRKKTNAEARMKLQHTPQFENDSDLDLQQSSARVNQNGTPRPKGRKTRMHTHRRSGGRGRLIP